MPDREFMTQKRSLARRVQVSEPVAPLTLTHRGSLSVAGIAVQGLVRFSYSLLIGRFLPAGFLSATNSAISSAMLTSLFWPTSIGSAAGKFIAREGQHPALRGQLASYLAQVSILTSIPLASAASVVTYFWLHPGDAITAVLVGLLVLGWAGYTFVRAVQYATDRVARASLWDFLAFLVAVLGLVAVLLLGQTEWLLAPISACYLLYTLAGWPRESPGSDATRISRHRLPQPLRHEINSYIAWGAVSSVATGGFLQLTMVLARQTGTVQAADAYAAALTLATPASMLGTVVSLMLLPALSAAVGRGDLRAAHRQTDAASRGMVALMGAIFGVLAMLSHTILAVLWPQLVSAATILEILLAATFLVTIATPAVETINSHSRNGAKIVAGIRVLGLLVGLAVTALLVPTESATGVAWGYFWGMVVTGLLPLIVVAVRYSHRWGGLLLRTTLGVALGIALLVARNVMQGPIWPGLAAAALFCIGWGLLTVPELKLLKRILRPA